MAKLLDPFRFLMISLAGWMNQHPLQAIDSLREENRVLREQLGDRRLRLTDDQHRRLATKANRGRRWDYLDWPKHLVSFLVPGVGIEPTLTLR